MKHPTDKPIHVATVVRPEIEKQIRIRAAEQGFPTKSAWFNHIIEQALSEPATEVQPNVR